MLGAQGMCIGQCSAHQAWCLTGDAAFRFVPIPRSLEKWLAIPFTKETIRDAKVLPADAPLVAAVQRLTDRITAAAALLGVHYDWKVYVVESDAQNAVCLPGGVVVVSTGVVMSLGELVGEGIFDSMDDALGTILCHEVGHAIARHQVEGLALQPWALALGATGPFFRWLATYGLALPYVSTVPHRKPAWCGGWG